MADIKLLCDLSDLVVNHTSRVVLVVPDMAAENAKRLVYLAISCGLRSKALQDLLPPVLPEQLDTNSENTGGPRRRMRKGGRVLARRRLGEGLGVLDAPMLIYCASRNSCLGSKSERRVKIADKDTQIIQPDSPRHAADEARELDVAMDSSVLGSRFAVTHNTRRRQLQVRRKSLQHRSCSCSRDATLRPRRFSRRRTIRHTGAEHAGFSIVRAISDTRDSNYNSINIACGVLSFGALLFEL
ncbi:hypothetical protein F5Y12DRAFT_718303 [Xylaria sp. FL1777]|nr:hypothetical protein F5Y12DRAFT_718303 [Xylaria sp. FL1777]